MSTSIGTTGFDGSGEVFHYEGYEDARKKFANAIELGGGIERLPRSPVEAVERLPGGLPIWLLATGSERFRGTSISRRCG